MEKLTVETGDGVDALYRRPGFLIRRAHQIAVSLFLEESEAAVPGITTTQYGALVVLRARQPLDQVGLAQLVGIDRSTTALVVAKLEEVGCIERTGDPDDRRRKTLRLTDKGQQALARLDIAASKVRERELGIFSKSEERQFLRLLDKFVSSFNAMARAPIRDAEPAKQTKRSRANKA
jgi:MarR family transcriptional regulator, lower aerobic nicotinate degradation pathway regulator